MANEPRKFSDDVADSLSKFSSGPAQRTPRAAAAPAEPLSPQAEAAQAAQALQAATPAPEAPVEDPVLARRRARQARAIIALNRSVKFKQMLVPVLLTTTVMMLITACTRWMSGEDSPFHAMPYWFTLTFLGFGALMGILAALTVWQLKHQLATQAQQQQQPPI